MDVDISKSADSQVLLKEIISLWITIQGYLYASKIVQTYQQAMGLTLGKKRLDIGYITAVIQI